MSGRLSGKVCLVTGATRGIGKGIALQLGEAGATVYITGRTLKPKGDRIGGSLEETAGDIRARGGTCIPVQCDHAKDEDIKALFERIEKEQNGRLDVLVNNAYSAVGVLKEFIEQKTPFWEQPLEMWDDVNNVGLRNHYFCTVYASKLMIPAKQGLIVNISSPGGLRYLFNVAYGVGKAALDRMAADCAHELRKHGVAVVALWPGLVKTEHMLDALNDPEKSLPIGGREIKAKDALSMGESVEFSGMCVAALAADRDIMRKTGRVLLTADLASEYRLVDLDGNQPTNMRQLKTAFMTSGYHTLAAVTPGFIKVPFWMLAGATHKF